MLEALRKATGALIAIIGLVVLLALATLYLTFFYKPPAAVPAAQNTAGQSAPVVSQPEEVVDGKDAATGLIVAAGWELVKANCTNCHAATLVTQNRATREGWEGMIRWMQRTQKLWDLGENEAAILDYLAKNYSPEKKGRRENLKEIEWYELEVTQ